MRIACLLIPQLPLAATVRNHPGLERKEFVVISSNSFQEEIIAISPRAYNLGVRSSHTLEQALFLYPSLLVHKAYEEELRSAKRTLLDVALGFSPHSELTPPSSNYFASEASVFMDVSNCQNFFKNEICLANAIREKSQELRVPSFVTIAGSRSSSLILARELAQTQTSTPRVINPGHDANALKYIPFELADLNHELADRLTLFGFQVFNDLRKVSKSLALRRLGKSSQALIDLSHGSTKEVKPAISKDSYFEESQDLYLPTNLLETIELYLINILNRLIKRLTSRRLVFGDINTEFSLDSKDICTRQIRVSREIISPDVLSRLILLSLETEPINDLVSSIKITTNGRSVRNFQTDLFRTSAPAPQILTTTIHKLKSLCGPENVGSPSLIDTHRTDLYDLQAFGDRSNILPPESYTLPAVRALRPPLPAQVNYSGGSPTQIRSALANGRILRCAGPWRITGTWWSQKEKFAFDYFDAWTEDSCVFRLRINFYTKSWEIDAIYD